MREMTVHKRVNKDDDFLLDRAGIWNIACKTKASSIRACSNWRSVTCKRCLKLQDLKQK